MNHHHKLKILLSGAVLLGACGSKASTNQDIAVNDSTANAAAAAMPSDNEITTTRAAGLAGDFMVGKWSAVDEDCSATLEFRKDGTTATPIGEAKWTIAGEKLSIDYGDGSKPTVSTIKPLGQDRIEITHESGTKETEKRC